MNMNPYMFGLNYLPFLNDARTRSISPENPTGEPGGGARVVPSLNDPDNPFSRSAYDLGQGWKVRPFLKPKPGETLTIMDVDGPGMIQHIWLTVEPELKNIGRACVIRMYWDDEDIPSVEVPMSDFFAVGHDILEPVDSAAVMVAPASGLNCYWPMPFRKHARITFTNESSRELALLAYQITYQLMDIPDEAAYFHAQWRRAVTERANPEYTIVDNISGRGRYVGTFLAWTQMCEGWFGEGEIKFFMDGDTRFPTICGTGTEDYFLSSFSFPESYKMLYVGAIKNKVLYSPPKWSLYRWHIMDPICFESDLRVTIQALGWWPDNKYQPLQEDIASVAYWYQLEPHREFSAFPPLNQRWPR